MGEYEEPKVRRKSEPLPHRPPGGGLFPLSEVRYFQYNN